MECHDVRLLLTFAARGCEGLDAAERAALQSHLEKCPECAALAQLDRRLDQTLGQLMRDVPVPMDLKEKVLGRLAAQRPAAPWQSIIKFSKIGVAAAVVALVITGFVWYNRPPPSVTIYAADLKQYEADLNVNWTKASAEEYFEKQGLKVRAPGGLDYQFLQRVEVVEFKGRKAAKMSFAHKGSAADVLVLSSKEFHLDPSLGGDSIHIERDEDFTTLIFYRGDREELQFRPLNIN